MGEVTANYYYLVIPLLAAAGFFYYYRRSTSTGGELHTPTLLLYAKDLTALAEEHKLDKVIGRTEEIERVIQVLARRTKNNPVLVGKAGVGKTAIVEGLAEAIASGKVPKSLQGKRVLALDLANIVAGTKYRGEFEQRLKKISDEIISTKRQIILFVDEVHTIAEAGEADGGINASDILKPPLARGDLQLVGATTIVEYQKYIKTDATLDRRFEPIIIDEPTAEETLVILHGIKDKYEKYHGVTISEEAMTQAIESSNAVTMKSFPDKAIDLMDEAAAKVSLEKVEGATRQSTVTKQDIITIAQELQESQKAGL